jgi:hypothetical protein
MIKKITPAVAAKVHVTIEVGDLVRYKHFTCEYTYGTVVSFETMLAQGAVGPTSRRSEWTDAVFAHGGIEDKTSSRDFPAGFRHVGGVMQFRSCEVYDFTNGEWVGIDDSLI